MFLVHNLLLTQNCTFIKTLIKINTINNTKVLKLNGSKCYCCLFSAIILLITQSNKSKKESKYIFLDRNYLYTFGL